MELACAAISDIPALTELLTALFSREAELSPDRETQRRGLDLILSHPETGHILVVRETGQILAMVSLLYTVSTALGAKVAWLEDMVVSPLARGRGIGSQLLEFAVRFAREQACRRLTLLTDQDNDSAQRFYRRQGFTHSPMIPLRLLLD
ncbi:MAG: GNAT family N-acetyltransferase [Syntrophobacteraceae bacterium]